MATFVKKTYHHYLLKYSYSKDTFVLDCMVSSMQAAVLKGNITMDTYSLYIFSNSNFTLNHIALYGHA